jgi:hypothetical protein
MTDVLKQIKVMEKLIAELKEIATAQKKTEDKSKASGCLMSEPTPLPLGDRFVDPMNFRILGLGGGKLLLEAWEDAIRAVMDAEYQRGVTDSAKEIERLRKALTQIEEWRSHTLQLAVDFGSNSVSDAYRGIARAALKGTP